MSITQIKLAKLRRARLQGKEGFNTTDLPVWDLECDLGPLPQPCPLA